MVTQRQQLDGLAIEAYVVPSLRQAGPVRRLIGGSGLPGASSLFELPAGLAVFHKNRAETQFMFEEIVRASCYLRHGVEIRAGNCVFDVGANIGLFALFAHLQCRDLRIFAFEPIPDVHHILERNFAAHAVPGVAFNCALGSKEGDTPFTYYPHLSVLSRRSADTTEQQHFVREFIRQTRGSGYDQSILDELLADKFASQQISCSIHTISTILCTHAIEVVDLLKIDVEEANATCSGELMTSTGLKSDNSSLKFIARSHFAGLSRCCASVATA